MFIKIGGKQINLDNVSSIRWVINNAEVRPCYDVEVDYLSDTVGDTIRFDTKAEWEKAWKIFDYAIKPLDLKPGA